MVAFEDQEVRVRLEALDAASLCDAASRAGVAVGVCDPAINLISAGTKLIGRVHPVVCDIDFLDVFKALSEAREGEALLIEAESGRAVVGELFASEAKRRGLAGIVIDGLVRDVATLRRMDLPVFARGTTPQAGTAQVARGAVQAASIGGVVAVRGDFVVGDEDGVVIIPADKLDAVLPIAEEIQRSEGAIFEAIGQGRDLFAHTNLEEHYQKRTEGLPSTLSVAPPPTP
jgi:4-hydroxy-4-methyl-2-oxoglutarate aldolase